MNYTIRGKEIQAIEREVWSLAERNLWEPETFDVLDKCIVPGKIFIDIGAWCGILSLYAEKLGAEVHAIEPDPVAFEELQENSDNVHCYNIAINYFDGHVLLNTTAINGFGNSESSLVERAGIKNTYWVDCSTLEQFINDYINIDIPNICLIKMDVEGAEVMILKQAAEWLAKHKPPMWISFHPGYFEDLYVNTLTIIHTLFVHYTCNVSIAEFQDAMHNPSAFHSFLFLPKRSI